MSARPGTPENPLRVAIVGAGPAGFYTAEHLLKPEEVTVEVDLFDRLPTPFGLVRAGVAPDHPKIKSVIRVYEKTAARDGFRFFGGIEIGKHLSAAELAERYHAVVYAYGTGTDRELGIPGEDLPGSHSATAFVAWYNGHPDYADHSYDLSAERVVVVGNGNVAADVARMLALTRDELEGTDTADHSIDVLADSGVREIVVLGRRGPAQAAFTNPEVRELGEMVDADIIIDPNQCELDAGSQEWLDSDDAEPTNRRNLEIFTDFANREPEGKGKRIVMRSRATAASSGSSSASTSSRGTTRAPSAPVTPVSARPSTAALCCVRSATAAWASTACRSTTAAARSPTRAAASSSPTRANRSRASTSSGGSSVGRAA